MGPVRSDANQMSNGFLRDMREAMLASVEDEQIRLATVASIDQEAGIAAKIAAEEALVAERLRPLGPRRLPTMPDGNCQFRALVEIANLDMSHGDLRRILCDFMVRNAWYTPDLVEDMRGIAWGNGCTLKAT